MRSNKQKIRHNKPGNPNPKFDHLAPSRWVPGQSGNPAGRPKKKPITEALEAIYSNPKEAASAAMAMAKKVKKGDVKAFAEVANRLEGRVVQQVEMKGEVKHEFTVAEMEKARAVVNRLRVIDVESKETEEVGEGEGARDESPGQRARKVVDRLRAYEG
jgi:hypothetical protein